MEYKQSLMLLMCKQGNQDSQNGQHAFAVINYTNAILLDGNNPSFYANRALSRYAFDESDRDAVNDYLTAIRLDPNITGTYESELQERFNRMHVMHVASLNRQAMSLAEQGNYTDAIEKYTSAIGMDNSVADYYVNRAISKYRLNPFDVDAENDYLTALGMDIHIASHYPTESQQAFRKMQAVWLNQQGNLQAQQGQHENAIRALAPIEIFLSLQQSPALVEPYPPHLS
jgi:tetratricopeptide (TPR) repeat protein